MSNNTSCFTDLKERNIIFQSTSSDLEKLLDNNVITFYAGFDITASSLHLGSFLLLKTIMRLMKSGHNAIILLGSFTSKIGDPTGKTQERKILSQDFITENKIKIQKQIARVIKNGLSGCEDLKVGQLTFVDNEEWLSKISYGEFLSEYARYFSVNNMIKIETAAERLKQQLNLSLLEFNYMILQGIDFYYLYKQCNCILQLGGSDQWSNILMGVDLVHKKLNKSVMGLTIPLLTTSDGRKMGKSEKGALWLDKELCSSYELWQFIRNIDDKELENLIIRLSDRTVQEIRNLLEKEEINKVKILLADEVVEIIHGEEELNLVRIETNRQFDKNHINLINIHEIKNSVLASQIDKNQIPHCIIEDLMILTGLADSKSDAKRKIQESAVRINGNLCSQINQKITMDYFINGVLCLEFGKKQRRYIFFQ